MARLRVLLIQLASCSHHPIITWPDCMSHPPKTPAVLYNGVSGECGKCGAGGESAASGQWGVSGE